MPLDVVLTRREIAQGVVERWERVPEVLGAKVRRMRRVLGLSQEQLAQAAQVSQGAVSRFESGQCGQLSFHTVAAVFCALVAAYAPQVERVAPDIRQALAVVVGVWPMAVEDHGFRVFEDAGLEQLLGWYHALDAERRALLVRLLEPLVELLAAQSDARGIKRE